MKFIFTFGCFVVIAFGNLSCHKVKDYFKKPNPDKLIETIHSATLTGYAANVAMSVMNGYTDENVTISSVTSGFPKAAIMVINLNESPGNYYTEKAESVTIAGLWADSTTAVLSMVFTNYHYNTQTFDLVGIKTIPVLKNGNSVQVVMANQDIQINPEESSILSINLNTMEFNSEILRLDEPRPGDVYVAVDQEAYFIDINGNGTAGNVYDDTYSLTGGGQLIELDGQDIELVQVAMVGLVIKSECNLNPLNGMALMRVVGLEEEGFPELGTAVLEFKNRCNGVAEIYAATGMFVTSNGHSIPFEL